MVAAVPAPPPPPPPASPWRAILVNGAGGALTAIIIGVLYLIFGRGAPPVP